MDDHGGAGGAGGAGDKCDEGGADSFETDSGGPPPLRIARLSVPRRPQPHPLALCLSAGLPGNEEVGERI